jgi:hydroxymethylpyrimidine/phosphomethylpyrimidine kinase
LSGSHGAATAAYPGRMVSRPVPTVLSIAGSDSGGGAGIQADLKAFARAGVHGMTAITALTAQNTVGVTGIHPVPGAFIVEQVRAVVEDLGVDAVKIGMLGTAETVAAVREALGMMAPGTSVVIDPVMVSESGAVLLDGAARAALVELLLPLATVITPNLPEARVLAGSEGAAGAAGDGDDAVALARALL